MNQKRWGLPTIPTKDSMWRHLDFESSMGLGRMASGPRPEDNHHAHRDGRDESQTGCQQTTTRQDPETGVFVS